MIAGILVKYLRNVKEFSKENASYQIIRNVKFTGTKNQLILSCCDGDSGIVQKLNQHGTPIIGSFCVNVFNLYRNLSKLDENDDLEFIINPKNYIITIKTTTAKFNIPGCAPDQIFELPEHTVFLKVDSDFFDKIVDILKLNLDDTYPIIYNGNYIYYVSPHTILYTFQPSDILPFKINSKVAPKLLIDQFTEIDITDNQIYLHNENCTIFIPQIHTNTPILDPIINASKDYVIKADVNIVELKTANDVIESLQPYNEQGIRSVDLHFYKNTLTLNYLDSEFIIRDVTYQHPSNISIKIPYDHIKIITNQYFAGSAAYLRILLSENNKMFLCQRGGYFFVGGLAKQ